MLTRRQLDDPGRMYFSGDYAETARQLAEWVEWMARARFGWENCNTCPAKFPNGCVDDWETCEVEYQKATAWLSGDDEVAGAGDND